MDTEKTEKPLWEKTATEFLIDIMAEFSTDEATSVAVVYLTEGGDVVAKSNTGRCLAMGMLTEALEMCKKHS